jgi:hypothetical protein
VTHVQIERHGSLVFAAYDNFHPDCVWVVGRINEQILEDLREAGILSAYKHVE